MFVLVNLFLLGKIDGLRMQTPLIPTPPNFHPLSVSRVTTRSVLLSWSPSTSAEITGYELQVQVGQWSQIYSGKGRLFLWESGALIPGTAYKFRVRAVSAEGQVSDWSAIFTTHTLLPAQEERFPVELLGMGRNNPGAARLSVDGVIVYNSTSATGLVLGVFSRSNFKLVSLTIYDTFNSANRADEMASALLALNSSFIVMIVSSEAWELNAHARLARAVDFCGGFHFGQWSRMAPVSVSDYTDITETADGTNFGHPYALLGIPGAGAGMGFESLQFATGHYLAHNRAPRAIVRAIVYFDYSSGQYQIRNAVTNTADYFKRQQVPHPSTVHNPLPSSRLISPSSYIERPSAYVPYLGAMPWQVEQLLSANSSYSKSEYESTNTGFQIVLSRYLPYPLTYIDSRTGTFLQTELERVWGGPSLRVDFTNGEILKPGLANGSLIQDRGCYAFMLWRFNVSSDACAVSGAGCCLDFDSPGSPEFMQYGVGLWPTLCINPKSPNCQGQVILEFFERYPIESQPQIATVAEVWL